MPSMQKGWTAEMKQKIVIGSSREHCAEKQGVTHCAYCKPFVDATFCGEFTRLEHEEAKEAVMARARRGAEALRQFEAEELTN